MLFVMMHVHCAGVKDKKSKGKKGAKGVSDDNEEGVPPLETQVIVRLRHFTSTADAHEPFPELQPATAAS